MVTITFGTEYLKELESEVRASRRCLEAIPENLYGWKPHEKSMNMGYLALLVADIPRWIVYAIEKGEIDFATYEHFKLSTNQALLERFDSNINEARRVLESVSNEELANTFSLKNNGQLLFSSPKKDSVQSSINHWVHHRGQLTVYMRLNNIPVPSIYGPSADDRTF
ncbi:MAG TPA: DinB family protein [Cyclobacteriaceae bacterium]|nr:DinB family protein [Cyclobacteriaceae bacterium]